MSYYGGLNLTFLDFKFDNQGEVWRSPLPKVSPGKTGLLDTLVSKKFTEIVLLLEDVECQMYTRMNLREAYLEKGFKVIHFPIPDYDVPKMEDMRETVRKIVDHANAGAKILIHCVGGQGRTGTVLGCIARHQLGLNGNEAIKFVREAIETGEQQEFICNFIEEQKQPLIVDERRDDEFISLYEPKTPPTITYVGKADVPQDRNTRKDESLMDNDSKTQCCKCVLM